jgi:cation diffusion facilitator CzcD-associated flavoprotein CzcO
MTLVQAEYDAVVCGAGPGGLAVLCALLDDGLRKILWVDRDFQGGRLNTMYREISR